MTDVLPKQVAEIRVAANAVLPPTSSLREMIGDLCDTVDDLREQLREAKPALLRAARHIYPGNEGVPWQSWDDWIADAATLRALAGDMRDG